MASVAVVGLVVIVPKNGVVPVATWNADVFNVPVAERYVPVRPPPRLQVFVVTLVALKAVAITDGSISVPVFTVALIVFWFTANVIDLVVWNPYSWIWL